MIPRLKEIAIPSIFPGCPWYLTKASTSREDPEEKKIRIENEQLKEAIEASMRSQEEELKKFQFLKYEDFLGCLEKNKLPISWNVIHKEEKCIFLILDEEEVSPYIKCSVIVDKNLEVTAYINSTPLKKGLNNHNFPQKLNNIRVLNEILTYVSSIIEGKKQNFGKEISKATKELLENLKDYFPDSENVIDFLINQIPLLTVDKFCRRYTPEILITSSILFSISPHAYKFLRQAGFIILPHSSTIKHISSNFAASPLDEQFDSNFLKYAKGKCNTLEEHQKIVSLMVDEIYIKEYLDFKGGNLVGMAFNSQKTANSAHVFMIQSLLSGYKDVVHILPIKTICATDLHKIIKKVILGLEDIGFFVICVVTDNNSINRKAMTFFSNPPKLSIVYEHPSGQKNRPLFFVIDTVHILKCIRNNWLNQRNSEKCMMYPEFHCSDNNPIIKSASLNTLKKLHEVEENNFITYNHTLSFKALNPSNLERQNVKLVLRIFNDFVIQALLELGEKNNLNFYKETAEYINLIYKWWCIVNVKHPFKGIRKKNDLMRPITLLPDDENVIYLNKFLIWLDSWKNQNALLAV